MSPRLGRVGIWAGAAIATAFSLLLAVTAPAAPPTLSLSATDATIGQTIGATADLSEGPTASGEISFEVFGPDDPTCTGPALETSQATVSGEGQYASADFTPAVAGLYYWSAHYPGDGENAAAEAPCAAISTVAKATPGLSGSASDGVVGSAIHDEATVTGGFSPSGEITFSVFAPGDSGCSTPLATTSSALASGAATSADFSPQQAGGFRWTATYPGDLNNEAVSTPCGAAGQSSSVSKASPGLSAAATAAVVVGQTITDEATLSSGFGPGGNLVFRAYGPGDETCAAAPAYEATVAVSGNGPYAPSGFAPGPGTYRWTVAYPGDANNEAVSLGCNAGGQTSAVAKASPGMTGSASSGVVGTAVRDTATLTGGFSPGGEVTFSVYGPADVACATPLETTTAAIAGGEAISDDFLPQQAGSFRWTASYPGDANNEAVSLGCNAGGQTSAVAKAAPGLAAAATSTVVGQAITDQATLSGGFSAGGQIVFRAYGPEDPSCGDTPAYEATVPVSGNGPYSPAGFAPGPGVYRWTVGYAGDANNEAVSAPCGAPNQASVVSKASPNLSGTATSVIVVGQTITDDVELGNGFEPGGELVFRAYGPGDETCAAAAAYEAAVPVSGNGPYSPPGFAPGPGVYQWTVAYAGDADNEAIELACGAANQASAVGTIDVSFTAAAGGGTVGQPIEATATIQGGATPAGQIVFKAFSPGDVNCSGAAAFSSTVGVAGNGSYRSEAFLPSRVGSFRWTAAYSGDQNHAPRASACGEAASSVARAKPTIAGAVPQQVTVGSAFRDTATLQGAYAPGGTVTFRIYGPNASGCAKPAFVNTVAVSGNGTLSSDPFIAGTPGRYSFVASYSGDAANQGATEPCDSTAQVVQVRKRVPRVRPRARLLGGKQISIRARLSGGASPIGAVTFRLYGPGDKRCSRKPAFSGSVTVESNGTFPLARYIATRPGIYRLGVGYSGDLRNQRARISCAGAQPIRVRHSS
ncbi:MAG TPA: hypothetical protein VFY48_02155 [Solirubrobacterales bacterium]|nr:hypothetical protein [Solirubrobacterales bacterium]